MKPGVVNLDKVGAFASAICAVHCVLTGLALGLLSVMGLGFLGSPTTELAFLVSAFAIGTVALVHGKRKHHSVVPALFFVAGLASWVISHFAFGHAGSSLEHAHGGWGTMFSVLGGACLVTFHVLNQRLQHQCGCNHCRTGH